MSTTLFDLFFFFFSSRRRHTRYWRDWSSDVCSSDLERPRAGGVGEEADRDRRHYQPQRRAARFGSRLQRPDLHAAEEDARAGVVVLEADVARTRARALERGHAPPVQEHGVALPEIGRAHV